MSIGIPFNQINQNILPGSRLATYNGISGQQYALMGQAPVFSPTGQPLGYPVIPIMMATPKQGSNGFSLKGGADAVVAGTLNVIG